MRRDGLIKSLPAFLLSSFNKILEPSISISVEPYLKSRIALPVIVGTTSFLTARLVQQGIVNTLSLRTLRHGTNPLAWVSIHLRGLDPAYGGTATPTGGTHVTFSGTSDNLAYVTTPPNSWLKYIKELRHETNKNATEENIILKFGIASVIPKAFTYKSTKKIIENYLDQSKNRIVNFNKSSCAFQR